MAQVVTWKCLPGQRGGSLFLLWVRQNQTKVTFSPLLFIPLPHHKCLSCFFWLRPNISMSSWKKYNIKDHLVSLVCRKLLAMTFALVFEVKIGYHRNFWALLCNFIPLDVTVIPLKIQWPSFTAIRPHALRLKSLLCMRRCNQQSILIAQCCLKVFFCFGLCLSHCSCTKNGKHFFSSEPKTS